MARHFTLAALAALALGASATVPFEVTTVTDGKFAPETKWYTMQIHADGYYLSTVDAQGTIKVTKTSTYGGDNDLWCFTGTEAEGFTIYNKALGAGMSLSAPSNPSASPYTDNGGDAYVCVKAPGTSNYSYVWDFASSRDLSGKTAFYMNIHGHASYAVNRRGENLAFWTAGKDGGSSLVISTYTAPEYSVSGSTLTMPGGATISCDGGTVAEQNGVVTLGEGTWTVSAPAGSAVLTFGYATQDGGTTEQSLNFYTREQATIQGPATIVNPQTTVIKLPESGYPIFLSHPAPGYNVPYRIPSICTVEAGEHKGRLFSVNDYRYSRADIGAGRIDLYMSYSDDNGKTWTEPDHMRNANGTPVAQGTGAATPSGTLQIESNLDCGFGDPASVSDRETGEILVVACCGRMGFFSGRRNNPQPSARWWSKDGGQTWTEPDYGQWEQIYALFDGTCVNGYIDSQFVGSGRMVQSKYIKVGTHYRIYCVMSGLHAATGNISNWVLYSDDFGHNWHILGGGMKPGIPASGDEPKAEELPDGSVLLAARGNGGGRNFNIFRYTDIEKGEGDWGTHINTNLGQEGGINACNGEIMIVPALEKATGTKCYLALQSYPAGPGRKNVSIAWLPLKKGEDFAAPENFRTWAGFFLVTSQSSAYSTMTWQHDNKVGFIFEEDTYGCSGGYTEIYRSLSIEEITGDAYEYFEDTDGAIRNRLTSELLKFRSDIAPGKYVGQLKDGAPEEAKTIAENFLANPSYASVVAFNNAMLSSTADVIKPEPGKSYRFISPDDGTYDTQNTDRYLFMATSNKGLRTHSDSRLPGTVFQIRQIDGSEDFLIYCANAEAYLPATPDQNSQTMTGVADIAQAGHYTFQSDIAGNTAIVCTNPGTAGYPAIHMKNGNGVVNWTAAAGKSKWYMELVEDQSSITEVGVDSAEGMNYFDLQGRRVYAPRHGGVYITSDRKKIRF